MSSEADHLEDLVADYIDRLNRGERLTAGQVRQDHPDLAEEILGHLEAFVDLTQTAGDEPLGVLGDYTLRRRIGRGGMGMVYEAWENSLGRAVALKVLPAGVAVDPRSSVRFLREAQAAGRLNHPNVVPVYAMGVNGSTPYYAMELVDGETLAQVLTRLKEAGEGEETPFGKKEDVRFFAGIAEAIAAAADGLHHAHSKGIIHRDIKPSNLILDRDGRLRILDFGLARVEGQESLTLSGDFVGTPLYMSPEQARRKKIPIDHRTDVYSLGVTLYELLALEPPFLGKDHADTLSRIIERDPIGPRSLNPRVPKDLETIALKCLGKEPADRYGTAEALAQDLRRFVRGEPIEARPRPRWEVLLRRVWRRRGQGAALATIGLFVLTSGLLIHNRYSESWRRAQELYRERVLAAAIKLQLGEMVIRAQGGNPSADPVRLSTSGFSWAAGEGGGLGPIQRALDEIEQAIRTFPREPDAYFRKAKGLLLLGREEEALRALDSAARAARDFVPATVLRAVLLEKRGDHEGAVREFERAKKGPDAAWAEAWFSAYNAAEGRRWVEAAEAYGRLIQLESGGGRERSPGSALEARLGRGSALLESQDFVESIADFSVAMTLWPDLPEPALLKGKAYMLLGNESAAERIFAEAYQRARFPDEVAQVLVILYAGSFGRFQPTDFRNSEKALLWADRLEDLLVKEVFKASCFELLGRPKEAEEAARKAIAANERSVLAYRALLWALMRLNRLGEAGEVARRALDLHPQDAVLHRLSGDVLSMQGRSDEFLLELRTATRLDPGFVGAHWDLADELNDRGFAEEALPEAEVVVRLAPDWGAGHGTLGSVLSHLGRFDEAARELNEAVRLDPRNPDVYNYCGVALGVEGKLDEALAMYQKSASLDVKKHGPWAHVNMALILEEQGRSEEAFLEHCRGIEADPHYNPAHDALPGLFRRLQGSAAAASALEALVDPLEALLESGEEHPGLLRTLALGRLHGAAKRDVAKSLEYIQRAVAKGDSGSGASSVLAGALWHSGRRREAVLGLEKAVASVSVRRYAAEQLEEYRRQLLPDFVSYASVDAALASLKAGGGDLEELHSGFLAVAQGEDADRRALYLEGRMLEQESRYEEAALTFGRLSLSDPASPEPVLHLAGCLRAAGRAPEAAASLRTALQGNHAGERVVLEAWVATSFADLGHAPAEVLAHLPEGGDSLSYLADLRWLLERLVTGEPVRVRCGGEEHQDAVGAVWGRDRFFVGGEPAGRRPPGLAPGKDGLGATARRFRGDRVHPAAYRIPLPRGRYRVTLSFCESRLRTAGRRRFDVLLEGQEALKDQEPLATGFGKLHSRSVVTKVDDGILDMELVRRVGDPVVSAIEVARAE